MNKRIGLFGCQIDCVRLPEAVDRVFQMVAMRSETCRYVVTPNLDHVVMLQEHAGLRKAYADAALVTADGMPLVVSSRLLGRSLPERVTGADLVPALFASAKDHGNLKVYLLGAAAGVGEQAAANIASRWPAVEVVGVYSPPLGFEKDPLENAAILARIDAAGPDVLVVGLGAPKQELWVHEHQHQINASVALCVGATIDFLAGHKSRAPMWMRRAGLEWLHRVASEPRRLLRRYARDAWHFPRIVWQEWRSGRAAAATHPTTAPPLREFIEDTPAVRSNGRSDGFVTARSRTSQRHVEVVAAAAGALAAEEESSSCGNT